MDENNNLNTNNDFEPVSTDPADLFVDEGPVPEETRDPFESAAEKLSDPAPEYPSVDDVAEEIPPEPGQIPPEPGQVPPPTPEEIARDQYTWTGGPTPQEQSGQFNNGQYNNGNAYQAQAEKPESSTLGILSLVLGIVSLVFFCSCFNIFTGIAAIIFGIVQLVNNKRAGRGLAIAGIITAAISIVGFFVFWGIVGGAMTKSMNDMDMDEFWEEYKDLLDDYGIDIEDSIPGGLNIGDDAESL